MRLMMMAPEEPRPPLKLCERLGFVREGESPPFVRLEWRG